MRVLLVDTAFAAVPIYDALVAFGHEVWVIGARVRDPLALRAGERWIEQDYSDVARVRAHVERLGIERVVPGCTDVSIETCAALEHPTSLLDPPEVTALLGNKAAFRRLCAELDLPAPRSVGEADLPRSGRFICKPVDAFSGRGIAVFNGADPAAAAEALAAARRESPTGEVLVEPFVAGQLYSCSGFVEGGRLGQVFFVREGSSANPYAVDTSHVVPAFDPASAAELVAGLDRLVAALRLRDGLLHTQFLDDGGRPSIVEITRRCPGDLYSLLIEYSTGYPYAARFAAGFTGQAVAPGGPAVQRHVLRHSVAALADTGFAGLRFREPTAVRAFFPILTVGEPLLSRQRNRAGVLFTEAASAAALAADYDRFLRREAYEAGWDHADAA